MPSGGPLSTQSTPRGRLKAIGIFLKQTLGHILGQTLGPLALGLAEDVALGLLSENPSGLQSTHRGRLITLGTTLGHRFTWLPPRLFHRLSQLVRVIARVGARAGQAPESRCSRSPLGAVQEGRQQAPDRPFQCTLGKSLYNFAGNERRQELFMTQALESD